MKTDYNSIQIKADQAAEIAQRLFQVKGEIITLPGELDFNFRIKNKKQSFVLKISRPDVGREYIGFQQELLNHVCKSNLEISYPKAIPDLSGNLISEITDTSGNTRLVCKPYFFH